MLSLSSATTQATDQADALKMTEAARSDPKHALWGMTPEQQREIYLKAFPGPLPSPVGPAEGAGAPPAPVIPAAPPPDSLEAIERDTAELVARAKRQPAPLSEEEGLRLLERRRALLGAQITAIVTQDDHGNFREAPDPGEQAPVTLTEAALPTIQLPQGVAHDDPAVREARELAFYAEIPAATVQAAITAGSRLLQGPPPSQEEVDAAEVRMLARVRATYGAEGVAQWGQNLEQGEAIAEDSPRVKPLLADPRTWNDFELRDIIAQLGARARTYYRRKVGTKVRARIS